MNKNSVKALPKPWEVSLSKLLCVLLPVAKMFVIVYMVMISINSTEMPWIQLGLQSMLLIAIHYSNKNFRNILVEVANADSDSGE